MQLNTLTRPLFGASVAALLITASACGGGPQVMRGSDNGAIDEAAMSTGLDRKDLQLALQKSMDAMRNSRVIGQWANENRPPVSVLPIRNETSEHIDSALGALITDVETQLVNTAPVRVISIESQQDLMREIQRQHHSQGAFDQTQLASWGKQLGARYFVTGKVFSTDERAGEARRVQYFLFIKVVSVETAEVLFQNQAPITKAIM